MPSGVIAAIVTAAMLLVGILAALVYLVFIRCVSDVCSNNIEMFLYISTNNHFYTTIIGKNVTKTTFLSFIVK